VSPDRDAVGLVDGDQRDEGPAGEENRRKW
jgi:hypothetical protein